MSSQQRLPRVSNQMPSKRILRFVALIMVAFGLVLFLGSPAPAQIQRFSVANLADQAYQQLSFIPRENQYISTETGQTATSNTLISRFIRYHAFLKGRSPNFRLDWKLTLADYLGANELMISAVYPGSDTLRSNPMATDVAAIQKLNRAQREQLISVLVNLFVPSSEAVQPQAPRLPTPAAPSVSAPAASPSAPLPGMGSTVPLPNEPKPGDARLLTP